MCPTCGEPLRKRRCYDRDCYQDFTDVQGEDYRNAVTGQAAALHKQRRATCDSDSKTFEEP